MTAVLMAGVALVSVAMIPAAESAQQAAGQY